MFVRETNLSHSAVAVLRIPIFFPRIRILLSRRRKIRIRSCRILDIWFFPRVVDAEVDEVDAEAFKLKKEKLAKKGIVVR